MYDYKHRIPNTYPLDYIHSTHVCGTIKKGENANTIMVMMMIVIIFVIYVANEATKCLSFFRGNQCLFTVHYCTKERFVFVFD